MLSISSMLSTVILHRDLSNSISFNHMNDYLDGLLGQAVFSDDRIVAYGTTETQLQNTFSFLLDGWWKLEDWNGVATRWMDGNGTINVVCPSSQYYDISFLAGTDFENKNLKIILNGEEVGDLQIANGSFTYISLYDLHFKKGSNELLFYSDQYFVPANILENNPDTRHLSIAFQNVTINK